MALPMLTRWSPLRPATTFDPFTDLEDLFRGLENRALSRPYERTLEMRMDVNEDDKAYRITVDMPGVKKEDIDVAVEGNQVTITCEVKSELSRDTEKEIHRERYAGKAFRTFSLPIEVDSGKADARYDGGVLNLTLPKKANIQAKRISIN